ncbi:3-hexulose-6-phosphate isomerase [Klebsiella spallanzanii]|jgi:6-phospho-3-hexuloisomerase|uniref:3-hexulose-6-phosphate isomerase n=1 Tax=Klebsiella spallanzanii TaxID=2587528 RepID=A0A564N9S2_9ENTR|nr:6-phospho-3-hexuloisomerase [Klebsiella spallanzanii]MDM4206969.1 6-phospho-3-hexuloisomerase [Klebsiella spallanzanii]VUS27814.1 3-hexulose-6-phosphate isomerase [Klebsiella spallanzanii]VUT02492.1 3-hexulose-6-phosphate isomerase [Klebsiella spallanzanii]
MNSVNNVIQASCDLHQLFKKVNADDVQHLEQLISEAPAVFVYGAGRSLLMLKAFAMRLMHIGISVHIVGDVVTPALREGDLLLLASASGETGSLIQVAKKARSLGGKIALLSIFPESTLGQLANVTVKLPAYTDKLPDGPDNVKGVLPGGSMFEESVLLLGDTLILRLAEMNGHLLTKGFALHANLE